MCRPLGDFSYVIGIIFVSFHFCTVICNAPALSRVLMSPLDGAVGLVLRARAFRLSSSRHNGDNLDDMPQVTMCLHSNSIVHPARSIWGLISPLHTAAGLFQNTSEVSAIRSIFTITVM